MSAGGIYDAETMAKSLVDQLGAGGMVEAAMTAFNAAVAGIVLSWSPCKKALALPAISTEAP